MQEHTSAYGFGETVERLVRSITLAGNTIFATIDQADAATRAGLDLRPTTLIVFGNPRGGTPLMAAEPSIALELPLKLLVWDDGAGVRVAHARMADVASRYGIAAGDPRIAAMDHALEALAASVSPGATA